jgi:hypothetical protein
MKTIKDAELATPQQLRGMTPPQVDELFAAAWDRRYELLMNVYAAWNDVHYAVGDRRISTQTWRMGHAEVQEKAAGTERGRKALDSVNRAKGAVAELDNTVLAKLENEFGRRGGWSRAYLVTDGHVHSSMHCSSCNRGEFPTRFSWMIDYSGKDMAEIVEAAGERACTICYPDAPVARRDKGENVTVPRSVMLTSEEIERAQAREAEAKRRAEKKAKAALNAITQPDGTPLRDEMGKDGRQRGSVVKTLRTAKSELKRECWYAYCWGDSDGSHERNIQHLGRAVAWKENGLAIGDEPTAEQIEAAIKPLRDKAIKEVEKSRRNG